MDRIVGRVFNPEHIAIIELEVPDPNFPSRIHGISCRHCDATLSYDADLMLDHLQNKHGIALKNMLKH